MPLCSSESWLLNEYLPELILLVVTLKFSLNGAELSLNSLNLGNSKNLRNHWGINWVQYKDLLCYMCLCETVVSSLSLTQVVLGFNPSIFLLIFNFFVTEFSKILENIQRTLQYCCWCMHSQLKGKPCRCFLNVVLIVTTGNVHEEMQFRPLQKNYHNAGMCKGKYTHPSVRKVPVFVCIFEWKYLE